MPIVKFVTMKNNLMLIASIAYFVISFLLFILRNKNEKAVTFAYLSAFIASFLLVMKFGDGIKGVVTAKYIYYINGIKVSSSFFAFFLQFIIFIVIAGVSMAAFERLGKFIGDKIFGNEKEIKWLAKLFSIICIILAIAICALYIYFASMGIIQYKVLRTRMITKPVLQTIVFAIIITICTLWGLIALLFKKK